MSRLRARSAWLPAGIVGGLAATMLVIAGCGGGGSSSDNGTAQKSVGVYSSRHFAGPLKQRQRTIKKLDAARIVDESHRIHEIAELSEHGCLL